MLSEHKIHKHFNQARMECLKSDFRRCPVGAILIYKGVPLAVGHNSYKTSTLQRNYNRFRAFDIPVDSTSNSLHAEIACLQKIRYLDIDFSKIILFVYREFKRGGTAMSRPCSACMAALKDVGIKHIYYTTNGGWAYERI